MPWYRDISREGFRRRAELRADKTIQDVNARTVFRCNFCGWIGNLDGADNHRKQTGHDSYAWKYMGGRGWRKRMERIISKELPFPIGSHNYKPPSTKRMEN